MGTFAYLQRNTFGQKHIKDYGSLHYLCKHRITYPIFRLLLLYHDPELCNALDSRRINPEAYAQVWVRGSSSVGVTRHIPEKFPSYLRVTDGHFSLFIHTLGCLLAITVSIAVGKLMPLGCPLSALGQALPCW